MEPEKKIVIAFTDDQAQKVGLLIHTGLQSEGIKHLDICAYLRAEILRQLPKEADPEQDKNKLNHAG